MASMCLTVTHSIPLPSITRRSCALEISTALLLCDIKCLVKCPMSIALAGTEHNPIHVMVHCTANLKHQLICNIPETLSLKNLRNLQVNFYFRGPIRAGYEMQV